MNENLRNGKNGNEGNHDTSSHKPEPLLPARGDRTVDQMIQSARSGKQNILEGSKAAQTSKEARFVRQLGCKTPQTFELYREFVETRPPEVIANIAICLLHQANFLIDQQLKTLEREFVEKGGLRERMTRVRLANRNNPGRK